VYHGVLTMNTYPDHIPSMQVDDHGAEVPWIREWSSDVSETRYQRGRPDWL